MEMKAVESKMFTSVGYDTKTQTLRLEFANGNLYEYRDVPLEVYAQLQTAESKGRFFGQHIRNRFSSARIEQPIAAGAVSA